MNNSLQLSIFAKSPKYSIISDNNEKLDMEMGTTNLIENYFLCDGGLL